MRLVLVRRSCSSSRSWCRRLPPTPSRSKGRGEAPPKYFSSAGRADVSDEADWR